MEAGVRGVRQQLYHSRVLSSADSHNYMRRWLVYKCTLDPQYPRKVQCDDIVIVKLRNKCYTVVSHHHRGFVKEAEEIGVSRRMNSLTLNRHTEILEILEIPQLMDTCVRNGYYEEALELAVYVKRLEKKHSSLTVIQVQWKGLRVDIWSIKHD